MTGPVLVTGGTGKTGHRLAQILENAGTTVLIATRTAGRANTRQFDWTAPETWDGALDGVTGVYLVAPPTSGDVAPAMIDFIRRAQGKGVHRFVLLSASLNPAGGPGPGQVHAWLAENAPDWAVLRPSWFMQNFIEGQRLASILAESRFHSAAEDGRVPFIDADDIAATAAAIFQRAAPLNSDPILTGPRALTHDEAAAIIAAASGRAVSHARIGMEDFATRHVAAGLPRALADILAFMDTVIAKDAEDRVTEAVKILTGRAPTSFEAFAKANAATWKP